MTDDAFRFDVLTGTHTAVVPARRGAWPRKTGRTELPTPEGRCPFCPGNEADTEETVSMVPAEDAVGWKVRVVRNLFPLVWADAGRAALSGGEHVAARGVHEVLVEHVAHDIDMADFDEAHVVEVLGMYRERVRVLAALEGVATVSAFRNRGRRAGSSQPHPHGQVVASPVAAPDVALRYACARAHLAREGTSLLDVLLERELSDGARIVEQHEHFVVLCPFAAHQNHHAMIVPRASRGSFAALHDRDVSPLAHILLRTLRRLRRAANDPAYNLVFRMPPLDAKPDDASFWFVDVLPRRGGGAGFELATGIDVVTVTPEQAASELRQASPL